MMAASSSRNLFRLEAAGMISRGTSGGASLSMRSVSLVLYPRVDVEVVIDRRSLEKRNKVLVAWFDPVSRYSIEEELAYISLSRERIGLDCIFAEDQTFGIVVYIPLSWLSENRPQERLLPCSVSKPHPKLMPHYAVRYPILAGAFFETGPHSCIPQNAQVHAHRCRRGCLDRSHQEEADVRGFFLSRWLTPIRPILSEAREAARRRPPFKGSCHHASKLFVAARSIFLCSTISSR